MRVAWRRAFGERFREKLGLRIHGRWRGQTLTVVGAVGEDAVVANEVDGRGGR